MYKKIIIPIDLSQDDKGAQMIDAAKHLADQDSTIYLINVVEDVPVYIAAELPVEIQQRAREDALQELKTIAGSTGIKTEVEVRNGAPATEILSAARDLSADLVLVASHKPGIQDIFLGSTAARVVRRAKCSVLVIR